MPVSLRPCSRLRKEGGRREERGGKGGRDRREDGVAAGRGEAEGGRREEEEGKTDKG